MARLGESGDRRRIAESFLRYSCFNVARLGESGDRAGSRGQLSTGFSLQRGPTR